MFSDFDGSKKTKEGRGRMGLSLAVSSIVYVAIGAIVVTLVATARAVVVKREREVNVEFAAVPTAPEPEKPKPKPKKKEAPPPETKKPKTEGQDRGLSAPTFIPDEVLREATSGDLRDAEDINIEEMIGTGKGKKRSGPRQRKLTVARPKFLSGCQAPMIPNALRASAETVRVRVKILVMPDGIPVKAEMEQSHPLLDDEEIIRCALAQRFEPARLPDGTAVPYPYRRQFTFKPSNI